MLSEKTPWPRGGPRCSAREHLERAFQTIERRLQDDPCQAVSHPGLSRTLRCQTSPPPPDATGSQRSHMEFQDVVAVWRKQRTGTFVTSFEPELRTSSDISQWTDRYWIADGRSRAPCASMNFTLAISTRSHDSSPHWSTLMVPEKVHAVPFTRKF